MIIDRRGALSLGLATAAAGLFPAQTLVNSTLSWTGPALRPFENAASPAEIPVRRAYLHNLHTGEWLDEVYFEGGRYVPGALAEAMRVLRDWRNGAEHMIDPGLFDLLHDLRTGLETSAPFQIISGYRSPATNAMLHDHSGEVAAKSQHLLGKALDIRVEGVDLSRLHRAALAAKRGGVGYYPASNFVHVDVGPVRRWDGT
jgi:uncharacterized protein YcbK (DUF882 family)